MLRDEAEQAFSLFPLAVYELIHRLLFQQNWVLTEISGYSTIDIYQ
jgi:hypothetical protein